MRRLMLVGVLLTVSMQLGACSGCGANNNNQTNNQTNNTNNPCTPGEAGCACTGESTCTGGAMCVNNVCVGASAAGLTVTAPGARSCEVLFEETNSARVLDATYGEGVLGAIRRKAPNVALAISRDADAELPASVGTLKVEGALADVRVKSVTCFDGLGAVIDGAQAALKE